MAKKILLTGATGYVGSKLLPRLLELGFEVHVLARNPDQHTFAHSGIIAFKGDIRDSVALSKAMTGCESAYYLVHGLQENEAFEYEEAKAAQVFTQCSNDLGLEKIVYLGGLGDENAHSPHLRSRHLTGSILALGRAKVLEFRASIVLGDGSTSYEIIKALVSRLPFLIDPKNLRELCQPIYWEDLIDYLVLGLQEQGLPSGIIEVGGTEQVSYADLLKMVAEHSSLERKVFSVPELDPRILAEVFELLVPEYARVGRHLIESLIYPTVVRNESSVQFFPEIKPRSIGDSLDKIGTIQSNLGTILSREHTLKVLLTLSHRFPEVTFFRGVNVQHTLQEFLTKQVSSFK